MAKPLSSIVSDAMYIFVVKTTSASIGWKDEFSTSDLLALIMSEWDSLGVLVVRLSLASLCAVFLCMQLAGCGFNNSFFLGNVYPTQFYFDDLFSTQYLIVQGLFVQCLFVQCLIVWYHFFECDWVPDCLLQVVYRILLWLARIQAKFEVLLPWVHQRQHQFSDDCSTIYLLCLIKNQRVVTSIMPSTQNH